MFKNSQEKSYDIDSKVKSKMSNIMKWIGFYREHIDTFVEDYLNIRLKLFQKIILVMMDCNMYFLFLAARGIGKTFEIAIYCCARCILYPGTKIVVTSGSRQQGNLVVEKIMSGEIFGASDNLAREIKDSKVTSQDCYIKFHNKSTIEVVASNEFARGRRCHILIVDEFRLVDKETIRDILQPMRAVPRQPKYINNPKYAHLVESNKEIYMSSAWYCSHWSYDFFMMYVQAYLTRSDYFVCALPYQLAVSEGIADKRDLENKMLEEGFSRSRWEMERECIFLGKAEEAFFVYEDLEKVRTLNMPLYPKEIYDVIDNKKFIQPEKVQGEIRVLTVDIALMGGKHNDNTAIFLIDLILDKSGKYKQYKKNVLYGETYNGGHTKSIALNIRRLYEDLQADYIVLDTAGNGLGVYDELVTEIYDKEKGTTYVPLNCMNNDEMALRCHSLNAKKVIYAIKASKPFNSESAIMLRDEILRGRVKILVNPDDAERFLKRNKFYSELDPYMQGRLLLPFLQTQLLVEEMLNLESEIDDNTVKLKEQSNKRKDRYSSLSYGIYFCKMLERNLHKPNRVESITQFFNSRKPKIR